MDHRISRLLLLFSIAAVALLGLGAMRGAFSSSPASRSSSNAHKASPEVDTTSNQPAPDFALKDINGKIIKLSDYKGKVVLLNFWATWCPPCRHELPDFSEFQKQYGPRGLQIIGIALDEEGPGKVKPFLAQNPLPYPVVYPDVMLGEHYGEMNVIPVTFLIDRKGIIRTHYVGMRKKEIVEGMIMPLLGER